MIPSSLGDLVAHYTWHTVVVGESSAKTYRLERRHHPTFYLKIDGRWRRRDLLDEKNLLTWLSGKLPVPEVVTFVEDANNDYLLLAEIPGIDAASLADGIDTTDLVKLLAQGLCMIHGVSIDNCPFERSLAKETVIAGYNVSHHLVDEDHLDDVRRGRSAEDLHRELLLRRPPGEDFVFTHGDYSLPNIIVREREIAGFVDWSRGGIGDRYKDLAVAARSIRRNLDPGLEAVFFSEYGIAAPDSEKIEYYMLLDEFF